MLKNVKQKTKFSNLSKRITDSAPISILTIDKKGDITFVNEYFRTLSASASPLHRNIFELPFFIRENLCPEYEKLLKDGTPVKRDRCQTRNSLGEYKYMNIVAVPLRNSAKKIDGAISMAVDVTETVVAQTQLEKLNDDLEGRIIERTRQLSEANKKLEKALELETRFISDASHELRTPLSIIGLELELSGRDFRKKKKNPPKIFSAVNREMGKINEILADLILATTIERGKEEIKTLEFDLDDLARKSVKRLTPFAKEKEIKITYEIQGQSFRIHADKGKIEKLFLNIIRNAIKYGNKNGWVKVRLDAGLNNNQIKISISDNGIGIPAEELPYIFDRFHRTELSRKTGEGGFGLGLSICKWIVDEHKGSIDVDSAVSKGSTFTIILPKSSESDPLREQLFDLKYKRRTFKSK
ncbi:MAG: ATP-binding protein [Candidatus Staskawiczbacteria bacterium]|jgi:signal transduction histidine kinase